MISHLGIDYGSRFAGTTAICFDDGKALQLVQSVKKQNADAFCAAHIHTLRPAFVMIDAPLSLPQAYFGKGDDFFFRKCDRELGAMSPMFLGGLTARAMQLRSQWSSIPFFETWPRRVKQHFAVDDHLSEAGKRALIADHIMASAGMEAISPILSQHAFDALLAWYAGWLKTQNRIQSVGQEDEGLIWF